MESLLQRGTGLEWWLTLFLFYWQCIRTFQYLYNMLVVTSSILVNFYRWHQMIFFGGYAMTFLRTFSCYIIFMDKCSFKKGNIFSHCQNGLFQLSQLLLLPPTIDTLVISIALVVATRYCWWGPHVALVDCSVCRKRHQLNLQLVLFAIMGDPIYKIL